MDFEDLFEDFDNAVNEHKNKVNERNKNLNERAKERKEKEQAQNKQKHRVNYLHGIFGCNSSYEIVNKEQYEAWELLCAEYYDAKYGNILEEIKTQTEKNTKNNSFAYTVTMPKKIYYTMSVAPKVQPKDFEITINERSIKSILPKIDFKKFDEEANKLVANFLNKYHITFPRAEEVIISILNGKEVEGLNLNKINKKIGENSQIMNIISKLSTTNEENLIKQLLSDDSLVQTPIEEVQQILTNTYNLILKEMNDVVYNNVFEPKINKALECEDAKDLTKYITFTQANGKVGYIPALNDSSQYCNSKINKSIEEHFKNISEGFKTPKYIKNKFIYSLPEKIKK